MSRPSRWRSDLASILAGSVFTARNRLMPITRPFFYRLGIVKVTCAFGEQEQVFVALGATVGHALGHRVGLRPNDVLPEPPAVSLERERHPPRYACKVLCFE